jgi:hypothetical protein
MGFPLMKTDDPLYLRFIADHPIRLLKKLVEPAPAGRTGVARVLYGRIETPAKYPVVSLACPIRTGDTQKPLLDHLGCLFQHPATVAVFKKAFPHRFY